MQAVPDKNIKFVDLYSERSAFEFFESNAKGSITSRHSEIAFKDSWLNSLTFYYDGHFVARYYKKFGSLLSSSKEPDFNGLAISPDNKYLVYGIAWSNGVWSHGPFNLYLFDIEEKNGSLIDENYNTNTPEFMVWTMDSKKFIYRHNNKKNYSKELVLITFFGNN